MRRLTSLLLAAVLTVAACASEDLGGEKLPADADSLVDASAEAMARVSSVRFTLQRTGESLFIDAAESMSLDGLEGRFSAPRSAEAIVEITVNESLGTKIGAVAIDDEVWMSNPVTGRFETLPPGFDIDPSLFFDPEDGWRPLLLSLADLEFVGEVDRGGTRYHVRGTAPADQMQSITAGLVRGQDVELDVWLHPVTALVTAAKFETEFKGDTSSWLLELADYGASFEITDPTE